MAATTAAAAAAGSVPPVSAADRELREMRDAIIHCDGSRDDPEPRRSARQRLAGAHRARHALPTRVRGRAPRSRRRCTPRSSACSTRRRPRSSSRPAPRSAAWRSVWRTPSSRDDQTRQALDAVHRHHARGWGDQAQRRDRRPGRAGVRRGRCAPTSRRQSRIPEKDPVRRRPARLATRADFLVGCALAATPWCGASLAAATEPGAADAFDALFAAVEDYLLKRSRPARTRRDELLGGRRRRWRRRMAARARRRQTRWLEETFGRDQRRRAVRMSRNPEAWTTASSPRSSPRSLNSRRRRTTLRPRAPPLGQSARRRGGRRRARALATFPGAAEAEVRFFSVFFFVSESAVTTRNHSDLVNPPTFAGDEKNAA